MTGSNLGTWALAAVFFSLALVGLQIIQLLVVLLWEDRQTQGLRYFGQDLDGRRRFKRILRGHARLLRPILHVAGQFSSFDFGRASLRYEDVWAPKSSCSLESFELATQYEPRVDDVFVVTQMKSGTTWMQYLVYEILLQGDGNLAASGQALNSISPWLESRRSVSVSQAPLIGAESQSRLIKTHLPAPLCPYSSRARYIYVARHPVSCFASCVDFLAEHTGRFGPDLEAMEDWFCSGKMWWGPWPAHVDGWWRRARDGDNVLFVHFEEMKRDLPRVAGLVSNFLGLGPIGDRELERVLYKCSFEQMRKHAEVFEVYPPHILATAARLFVQGDVDRYADVPAAAGQRIRAWCVAELKNASYPFAQIYHDAATTDVLRDEPQR